ncbi:MAG: hypothetical protein DDT19_00008 [Syntrophomonadaceae bacterium]|nr:hypothetical protein [Bacillota bacterium]
MERLSLMKTRNKTALILIIAFAFVFSTGSSALAISPEEMTRALFRETAFIQTFSTKELPQHTQNKEKVSEGKPADGGWKELEAFIQTFSTVDAEVMPAPSKAEQSSIPDNRWKTVKTAESDETVIIPEVVSPKDIHLQEADASGNGVKPVPVMLAMLSFQDAILKEAEEIIKASGGDGEKIKIAKIALPMVTEEDNTAVVVPDVTYSPQLKQGASHFNAAPLALLEENLLTGLVEQPKPYSRSMSLTFRQPGGSPKGDLSIQKQKQQVKTVPYIPIPEGRGFTGQLIKEIPVIAVAVEESPKPVPQPVIAEVNDKEYKSVEDISYNAILARLLLPDVKLPYPYRTEFPEKFINLAFSAPLGYPGNNNCASYYGIATSYYYNSLWRRVYFVNRMMKYSMADNSS